MNKEPMTFIQNRSMICSVEIVHHGHRLILKPRQVVSLCAHHEQISIGMVCAQDCGGNSHQIRIEEYSDKTKIRILP